MKIIHPICCGMDIHKKVIVATIASTNKNGITTYERRVFKTLNPDLWELRDWLINANCKDVCMESTGKYWIPVFNVLEEHAHVILTHPKYVRSIKGQKTDNKDSKWIADIFKLGLVKSSFIPPVDIRACRDIARYRFKLVSMRSSEKNRYQDCMTTSNIALASVLSDPFGKTAQGIMDKLIRDGVIDKQTCVDLIKGTAKKKTPDILKAISGCNIRSDQRFKLSEAKAHMEYLNRTIARTELELYARLRPYHNLIEMLSGIPGINELASALIISEIGSDMDVFESANHLASWAGLVPTNNESAGKKKSVRISRAGQYLKPLLVQCALSAVKCKTEPYFALKYAKIKKRRGHKKAIIAIARMMMVCIYHMIKNGEFFNPVDYGELKDPHPKPQAMTEKSAIEYLRLQGYDVTGLAKAG